MAENKQRLHQALVTSIVDAVTETFTPLLGDQTTSLGVEFAELKVTLNAILVRLEALEASGITAGGGAKRPPRGERKTGGTTSKKGGGAADPYSKVSNSWLYTRRMWLDSEEFRGRFLTPELREQMAGDPAVAKHEPETAGRLGAEAKYFWDHKTPEQQKILKDEFDRWKEDRKRGEVSEPLAADDDADGDAVDAGAPGGSV